MRTGPLERVTVCVPSAWCTVVLLAVRVSTTSPGVAAMTVMSAPSPAATNP